MRAAPASRCLPCCLPRWGCEAMLGLPSVRTLPRELNGRDAAATSSVAEDLASVRKSGHEPARHHAKSCGRLPGMQPHGDSRLGVAGRVSVPSEWQQQFVPQLPHGKSSATVKAAAGSGHWTTQAAGMSFTHVLSSCTRLATKARKRVQAEALLPHVFRVGHRVVQGGCQRSAGLPPPPAAGAGWGFFPV